MNETNIQDGNLPFVRKTPTYARLFSKFFELYVSATIVLIMAFVFISDFSFLESVLFGTFSMTGLFTILFTIMKIESYYDIKNERNSN